MQPHVSQPDRAEGFPGLPAAYHTARAALCFQRGINASRFPAGENWAFHRPAAARCEDRIPASRLKVGDRTQHACATPQRRRCRHEQNAFSASQATDTPATLANGAVHALGRAHSAAEREGPVACNRMLASLTGLKTSAEQPATCQDARAAFCFPHVINASDRQAGGKCAFQR